MAAKDRDTIRSMTRYSAEALEMGVSVVVGAAIGWAIQHWFWPGSKPWMLLFWIFCGTVAGIRSLYRLAKKLERDEARDGGDDPAG